MLPQIRRVPLEWIFFILLLGATVFSLIRNPNDDADPVKHVLRHKHWVQGIAFSPDGQTLACAAGRYDGPGEIVLWDIATGEQRLVFEAHSDMLHKVAFSPDGKKLATCAKDQSVKIWEAATGHELASFPKTGAPMHFVTFDADGTRVLSGSFWGGSIRSWDLSTGRESGKLPGIGCLAVSHSGQLVASVAHIENFPLSVWDINTKEMRGTFRTQHTKPLSSLAFSPDDKLLASASLDSTVEVWDTATRQPCLTLTHPDYVLGVAFSPDGDLLASAGQDGKVRIWSVATGQEIATYHGHKGPVLAVDISPDGELIASGGYDKTVRVSKLLR